MLACHASRGTGQGLAAGTQVTRKASDGGQAAFRWSGSSVDQCSHGGKHICLCNWATALAMGGGSERDMIPQRN
jgi:hypothetical protein